MASSDYLFHFTSSLDILYSIVSDKFYGSYCKERFQYKGKEFIQIVPKISFCDITESAISSYTSYGKYCIGLKQQWGIQGRLNPVLYIEKHSRIAESLLKGFEGTKPSINFIDDMIANLRTYITRVRDDSSIGDTQWKMIKVELSQVIDTIEKFNHTVNFSQYSLYYVKHYQDVLERKDMPPIENYRFYDEQEWCYIPDLEIVATKYNLSLNQYEQWREENQELEKRILKDISLSFCWSDITHLIVEHQEDKLELIAKLEDLQKQGRFKDDELQILLRKIMLFPDKKKIIRTSLNPKIG